jgi:hypothetical protein
MAARSGQTTVTTAGTAVALGAASVVGYAFAVKALAGNAGLVYVGNDGADDVTSANGYEMSAGDQILAESSAPNEQINLAQFFVDAAENGDKVAWLRLR